jgi:hypothetical protein
MEILSVIAWEFFIGEILYQNKGSGKMGCLNGHLSRR